MRPPPKPYCAVEFLCGAVRYGVRNATEAEAWAELLEGISDWQPSQQIRDVYVNNFDGEEHTGYTLTMDTIGLLVAFAEERRTELDG